MYEIEYELIQLLNLRNWTHGNVLRKMDQFLALYSHGDQGYKNTF
jgi:hypothetical protein